MPWSSRYSSSASSGVRVRARTSAAPVGAAVGAARPPRRRAARRPNIVASPHLPSTSTMSVRQARRGPRRGPARRVTVVLPTPPFPATMTHPGCSEELRRIHAVPRPSAHRRHSVRRLSTTLGPCSRSASAVVARRARPLAGPAAAGAPRRRPCAERPRPTAVVDRGQGQRPARPGPGRLHRAHRIDDAEAAEVAGSCSSSTARARSCPTPSSPSWSSGSATSTVPVAVWVGPSRRPRPPAAPPSSSAWPTTSAWPRAAASATPATRSVDPAAPRRRLPGAPDRLDGTVDAERGRRPRASTDDDGARPSATSSSSLAGRRDQGGRPQDGQARARAGRPRSGVRQLPARRPAAPHRGQPGRSPTCCFVIGLALLIFELFTAGVGVAGVVGAGCLRPRLLRPGRAARPAVGVAPARAADVRLRHRRADRRAPGLDRHRHRRRSSSARSSSTTASRCRGSRCSSASSACRWPCSPACRRWSAPASPRRPSGGSG